MGMKTKAAEQLIAELRVKQEAEHLNDAGLARRLGISKALWSVIQAGKAEPNMKVLKGTLRAYPDLAPYVTLFLQAESKILNIEKHNLELEAAR